VKSIAVVSARSDGPQSDDLMLKCSISRSKRTFPFSALRPKDQQRPPPPSPRPAATRFRHDMSYANYTLQPYSLPVTFKPLTQANQNCHDTDESINDLINDPVPHTNSLGVYPNKRNVNKQVVDITKSTASRSRSQRRPQREAIGARGIVKEETNSFRS
jgi:hypothetical protein